MYAHHWSRASVLCAVVLVGFSAAAGAQVFDNPWDSTATDAGMFSQPTQIVAGAFDLGSSASVNRATWRGTMFSSDPLNTGDTWSFDVVFRSESGGEPGTVISTASVVASVIDTGVDIEGERVYVFDASFADVALSGGTTYFMSVINTGTVSTFRWNLATNLAYPAYYSSDSATTWDTTSTRPTVNFALFTNGNVTPPSATGIAPDSGPAAGGTSVTITGTNLTGATAVTFGGVAALSFTVDLDTQITATTPPHAPGAVDVTVTTPGGDSTLTSAFTYVGSDIPSLSTSGLILLAGLLALGALAGLRRTTS